MWSTCGCSITLFGSKGKQLLWKALRRIFWESVKQVWEVLVSFYENGQCEWQFVSNQKYRIFEKMSKIIWKVHFWTSIETANPQHHKYLAWLYSKINKNLCITCGCSVTFFRSMWKQRCWDALNIIFRASVKQVWEVWETFYENEHCESQFVSNWNYRIS